MAEQTTWAEGIIAESRWMREVVETIGLVAGRRCTVLIGGETGTGKEVVARAIHLASPRAGRKMVALNCAALPESLLEAELFGHMRGAFTGALNQRVGRFEQAHGGTLFLDEVGEMPLSVQSKLLRVLQEREFERLGSSETMRVDVRVIAATNADLAARVKEGKFREDLYYRLNVVPIHVAPLRERKEDIPPLARHFVERICREEELPGKEITSEAIDILCHLQWPGNVRQLENAIEMAVALSGERQALFAADFASFTALAPRLPGMDAEGVLELPESGLDFERTVGTIERGILEQALKKTGGNKTLAAELLRLKRTTLTAKLRSLESGAGLVQAAGA